MKNRKWPFIPIVALILCQSVYSQPELKMKDGATQLFVNGKPRIMLGVEITNKLLDMPEDMQFLDENLDMYKKAGVNTIVAPFAWYAFEPERGKYDYTMIDAFIKSCRERDLMLIPLWFGSIKNGHIGYVPDWFKNDPEYFRAVRPDGSKTNAISPFCSKAMEEDKNAFKEFMKRIKEKDRNGDVVVMVQPNNETGVSSMDNHRDMSEAAIKAWNSDVPENLMKYLAKHDGNLKAWLQKVWEEQGKKTSGTWLEIFGNEPSGHKIFMSYYMGKYVGEITEAGKTVYDIPMFVNDWLGSIQEPGGPIGGPDYQVHDIWRAAAPAIDLYAPDIYAKNFKEFCNAYHYEGNPLIVPEAVGKKGVRGQAGPQAWYTFIHHDGLLYAPYLNIGDEYNPDPSLSASYFKMNHLDKSYPLIKGMEKLILQKQKSISREMIAFLVDATDKNHEPYKQSLKGIDITATPLIEWPKENTKNQIVTPFAVIIWLRENEFLIVGTKMKLQFAKEGADVEVQNAQLGRYIDNEWHSENFASFISKNEMVEYTLPMEDLEIEEIIVKIK